MGLGVGPGPLNGVPAAVLAVWLLSAAGWGAVLAGLRRGLRGRGRAPALFLHAITPPTQILAFATVGFGSLHAAIALGAEWWALLLVTGLRPERLVQDGGLRRCAAWLVLAATGAALASHAVG
ncbi:hypothetical protein [Actinomadura macrotermitis]|uniref:Uncharacterized protein n=1 Tax=Actinomadura macrotermitis TaxID=2585200 RepID=A0A7K0BZ94_9ACTN|nr:hypothetical protein [Actinomadura macrotermitis]